jgi:hypothetical protein
MNYPATSRESDCWLRLGGFHHLPGEQEQAVSCHRRAVALRRGLGDVDVRLLSSDEAWKCHAFLRR